MSEQGGISCEETVSLVVPLRDESNALPVLLDSIRVQSRPFDEVILVDAGSQDGTAELARKLGAGIPGFRVLEVSPAWPGRARNEGLAAATGDWVAFTDGGVRLDPAWLAELIRTAASHPDAGAIWANLHAETPTAFHRLQALAYLTAPRRVGERLTRGPSIAGALIRADVLRRAGPFPDWRAAEDLAFIEALEATGTRFAFSPEARMHWSLSPDVPSLVRRFALYSRHNARVGRTRQWHRGVARYYLVALPCLLLATLHSPLWLALPPAGLWARAIRSLIRHPDIRPRSLAAAMRDSLGVAALLLLIDAAMFWGWVQAIWDRPHREVARAPS